MSDNGNNTNTTKATRKAGWLIRDLFEWGETLVSAVIVIVFVFTFAVRVTSVDGGSMMPTLFDGDQMLVTNICTTYKPKHNDIVVLYAPNLYDNGKPGKDIIKRVIGVEGDKIRIDPYEGRVYRNGEVLPLEELDGHFVEDGHLINNLTIDLGGLIDRDGLPEEVTVPDGHIFVLGDNRGSSVDSRTTKYRAESMGYNGYVDMVNVNHVAGKAFFRVAGDSKVWGSFSESFGFVK